MCNGLRWSAGGGGGGGGVGGGGGGENKGVIGALEGPGKGGLLVCADSEP